MSSFIYSEISSEDKMYDALFSFFFSKETLYDHFRAGNEPLYEPTQRNFVSLYRNLHNFIDDENIITEKADKLSEEALKIMKDEGMVKIEGDSVFIIRNDKVGKIGEYLFSILLEKYFDCDCIIPKTKLITDPNMSVYGIDTLHYSQKNKIIMFGESKFTMTLASGVHLIKESLKNYEKQLKDEYTLVLSNKFLNLNIIPQTYGNEIGVCISFEKFLEEAKIDKIGIPLFVAHGDYGDNIQEIFSKINSFERVNFFGKETLYTIISFPVLSKEKVLRWFTIRINEMLGELNG
jgi:hypothetical protein